jgi:hypothetical protein
MTVFLVVDNIRKVAQNEDQGDEIQEDFVIFFRPTMNRRAPYDRTLTE